MERLSYDGNHDLAVGVSRTHAMSTSLYRNGEIFCFDRSQNIANYTISLAIRSGYGISPINKIIRSILEGGLNLKWQREIRSDRPSEAGNKRHPEAISINETMTVLFFVIIPYLSLATLTFIAERLIAARKANAPTANKREFWTRLEKLFDGERHMFKLRRE